jgi:hypothetical protein
VPESVWGDVEPEVGGGEGFLPDGAAEPVAADVPVRVDCAGLAWLVFPGGAAGGAVGGDGVLAVAAAAFPGLVGGEGAVLVLAAFLVRFGEAEGGRVGQFLGQGAPPWPRPGRAWRTAGRSAAGDYG